MAVVTGKDSGGTERLVRVAHSKFLVRTNGTVEGHRGLILALHRDMKRFVVLATTTGDGVVWGKLYLVAEENPTQWPYVVSAVDAVPDDPGWSLYWLDEDWDRGKTTSASTTAEDPADVPAKPPDP